MKNKQARQNMAFQNRSKVENKVFSCPVLFEGGLQSCVRADLIIELLQYILYERQQIPLSFAQIKRQVSEKVRTLN